MGGLDFWELLRSQLINIPTNNLLGMLYVILNSLLLVFATLFGDYSGDK